MRGLVYKSTGSWYSVKTPSKEQFDCRIKGKFRLDGIKSTNPIAVGDYVDFEEPDKRRHLVRIFLRNEGLRSYMG